MCATFCKRNLVMYFFYFNKDSLFVTNLTERMSLNITVTDAFPRTTISSPSVRVSLVLLVTSVLFLLMFLTEPTLGQLGTSGMVAWVFRFSWHSSCTSTVLICNEGCKSTVPNNQLSYIPLFPPPSLRHNKSPHSGVATMKAYADFSFSLFADYTISQRTPLHLIANHSNFQIYTIFWKNHSSDCFVMPSLNCGRIHI